VIGPQYQGGSVDEVAVRRDDELLELLGGRTAPLDVDVAGSLLWALSLDVDREIAATSPQAEPVDMVAQAPWRRRQGARGTVIGVVVAATLSVSGVAAAVTGDPLAPYRAVLSLAQDDDPPSPRRSAAPDPVRRQTATTGQTGGLVAGPDVALGRVAVGDAQVPGRGANAPRNNASSKPTEEQRRSGRPDGTTGRPETPGRSADRAERATAAKDAKGARGAKDADAKQAADEDKAGNLVGTSGGGSGSQRGRNTDAAKEEKAQGGQP